MNSAIVAAALVRAIFITRRSPKAMDIMELTAIRWNETMPSQVFFPMLGSKRAQRKKVFFFLMKNGKMENP